MYIQHSFCSYFHYEIYCLLLLVNPVHGKESLLLLCFTLVIKFLVTSELDWALLGKWLSLQYKNLVTPKKEEKGVFCQLCRIIILSLYLQVPYKPEHREWKWHSRTKAKPTEPRSPLSEPNTLYPVYHISIKESGTSEIRKNITFCFAYKCMYAICNKPALFCEDIFLMVRQGMLHDQFDSTFTEMQQPDMIRKWIWIS